MIVLDTNALIWWISNSDKLSQKAKKTIEEAEKRKTIYISSMSILEICLLVKKNKLNLGTNLNVWLQQVETLSYVHFVPMDNKIAFQSVDLDFSHKDPADRIIIATALKLGAKLITADEKILNYKKVQTVW